VLGVDFIAPGIEVDGGSEGIATVDVISVLSFTDRRVDTAGSRIRPASDVNPAP